MRNYFLTLIFIWLHLAIFAQEKSPYHISWQKDGWILGTGLLAYSSGVVHLSSRSAPNENDINNLNSADVWSFGRGVIGNNSVSANHWSDVLLFSSYAYPVLLMTSKKKKGSFLPNFIVLAESYTWARGITFWTKSTVRRYRPFAYDSNIEIEKKTKPTARTSFISGHSSTTAVLCFTSAKMFADHFPDAKAKPFVWAGATAITGTTAYLRVAAGKHFPTDVILGSVVGATIGILIPHWHKKKRVKKLSWNFVPTDSGILFVCNF